MVAMFLTFSIVLIFDLAALLIYHLFLVLPVTIGIAAIAFL
jgi:hypothetical protein